MYATDHKYRPKLNDVVLILFSYFFLSGNVLFLLCEQKKNVPKWKLRFRESSEKLAFQMPNVSSLGEAKRHQQVSRSYRSIVMRWKNSELATLRPFPTMLERAFGIIASLDFVMSHIRMKGCNGVAKAFTHQEGIKKFIYSSSIHYIV